MYLTIIEWGWVWCAELCISRRSIGSVFSLGCQNRPRYSPPDGWAHGLSFLYMTLWCSLSNLCITIFPHEHEPSPIKTVHSLFFPRSKITNVLLEDADRKVMFKRIHRFLFVEKEKLLQPGKIDFNVFDQVFLTAERLFCFEMHATKTAKFVNNFQVHFSHYCQKNYAFKREFVQL